MMRLGALLEETMRVFPASLLVLGRLVEGVDIGALLLSSGDCAHGLVEKLLVDLAVAAVAVALVIGVGVAGLGVLTLGAGRALVLAVGLLVADHLGLERPLVEVPVLPGAMLLMMMPMMLMAISVAILVSGDGWHGRSSKRAPAQCPWGPGCSGNWTSLGPGPHDLGGCRINSQA